MGDREHQEDEIQKVLTEAGSEIKSEQDRKPIVRKFIADLGGLDADALSREYQAVAKQVGLKTRFYEFRHSVSTDMDRAGVSLLTQRYLTNHSCNDILNEYVSIDPAVEMKKYFDFVRPLLTAILDRGHELNCIAA